MVQANERLSSLTNSYSVRPGNLQTGEVLNGYLYYLYKSNAGYRVMISVRKAAAIIEKDFGTVDSRKLKMQIKKLVAFVNSARKHLDEKHLEGLQKRFEEVYKLPHRDSTPHIVHASTNTSQPVPSLPQSQQDHSPALPCPSLTQQPHPSTLTLSSPTKPQRTHSKPTTPHSYFKRVCLRCASRREVNRSMGERNSQLRKKVKNLSDMGNDYKKCQQKLVKRKESIVRLKKSNATLRQQLLRLQRSSPETLVAEVKGLKIKLGMRQRQLDNQSVTIRDLKAKIVGLHQQVTELEVTRDHYVAEIEDNKVKKKTIPEFVDFVQLKAVGGAGGQGLPKFGGFGGNGGNVIVTTDKKAKTLKSVLQKYPRQFCKAGTGENSTKFHLLGEQGKDLVIPVPKGIIVHRADGKKVDLNQEGETCTVAEGGVGGNHNTKFLGLKGQENIISLELKLLADVGLVGFPNAGKSTFLNAISKAKPRISEFPFTTIAPQIGMMVFNDSRKISVADLPGLIEGAHQNFGMGMKFLRHAERTKLLLFVLDINPFQLSEKYPERTPFETLLLLNKELEEYGHGMLDKPAVLVLNKIDTDPNETKVGQLMDLIRNLPDSLDQVTADLHPTTLVQFEEIFTMSAKKKKNIMSVINGIREVMDVRAEKRQLEELEQRNMLDNADDCLSVHDEHAKTKLI